MRHTILQLHGWVCIVFMVVVFGACIASERVKERAKVVSSLNGGRGQNFSVKGKVTVEAEVLSSPAVEGKKCQVEIVVCNHSGEVIIVTSIVGDGEADEVVEFLYSKYGRVSEKGGKIYYNELSQRASRKVFFSGSSLIAPHEKKSFLYVTRFFGGPKSFTISYRRFPLGKISKYIYLPESFKFEKDLGSEGVTSGFDKFSSVYVGSPDHERGQVYVHAETIDEVRKSSSEAIFWDTGQLQQYEVGLDVAPEKLLPSSYPLSRAVEKIPSGEKVDSVHYSDTFQSWVIQVGDGTYLVSSEGIEKLGKIEAIIFEKIDEKDGKAIRFRVPEKIFKGKFAVYDGDGMYTVGKFITVSDEEVLDVFRLIRDHNLQPFLYYYFFSKWYIDVTKGD